MVPFKRNILYLFLLVGIVFTTAEDITVGRHTLRLGDEKIQVFAFSEGLELKLKGHLSVSGVNFQEPFSTCETDDGSVCFQWGQDINKFTLKFKTTAENCNSLDVGAQPDATATMCFPYGTEQWFGGPERSLQEWPVQIAKVVTEPYVTREANGQGVLEPYWVSSSGSSIYVNPEAQLFFDSNNIEQNSLCLLNQNKAPYNTRNVTQFVLDLCEFDNIIDAQYNAINTYFGIPKSLPSRRMIEQPTYSTWVKYKRDINQDKLRNFTDEIIAHDFPIGQIEIDDKWETCYGSLTFDTDKFPNVTELTDYIHSLGGRATFWVHPFVNWQCLNLFTQFRDEGRLVPNGGGSYLTTWWNGVAGAIDISNETTKDWWVQRLRDVVESSGLDAVKFDAGETSWLPQLPVISVEDNLYPDSWVRKFVEAVAEFGPDLEVRVGRRTQDIPIFIRMLDKDSRWGLNNGLQSIVTTAFEFSLVGYPFILPDMIGGNAYGETVDKELFIRWTQANAFLPAMQFSILPWDYDAETVDISRRYVQLHSDYSEDILRAANKTLTDGTPIILPIWWYAANDTEAFPIWDEYMTGDRILVAPVLSQGVTARNIYLPAGTWVDPRNETFQGPIWINNYPAPLDFLPYFLKQ